MPRVVLEHLLACQKGLRVLPARIPAGILQYRSFSLHIGFSERIVKFTLLPFDFYAFREIENSI